MTAGDRRRLRVPQGHGGARLDVVLADLLDVSRSRAARLIEQGAVTVGGEEPQKSDAVDVGTVIEVAAVDPEPRPPPPELPPVRYRDEHLLVVAKPAGLVVHPAPGWPGGTLVDALRAAGVPLAAAGGEVRPGIVHRLDRDTSGLLAVASTDGAYRGLVEALKRREVEREYTATVEGHLPHPRGRIEGPIGRHPADRQRFAVVRDGKRAVTHWEVARTGDAAGDAVSRLLCRLETGRTHQIRVHLSSAGHPVVADETYGASGAVAATLGLARMFLHAGRLAFAHPVAGTRVDVTEPLPADLAAADARIRYEAGDEG